MFTQNIAYNDEVSVDVAQNALGFERRHSSHASVSQHGQSMESCPNTGRAWKVAEIQRRGRVMLLWRGDVPYVAANHATAAA